MKLQREAQESRGAVLDARNALRRCEGERAALHQVLRCARGIRWRPCPMGLVQKAITEAASCGSGTLLPTTGAKLDEQPPMADMPA